MNSEKNNKVFKPELLAPAGSIESFHAAIAAGADAIYLGVGDLNARVRAKNFTMKTLSYLVPYAHSKNVKVYVTLNTLIKQTELKNILNTLYQLEQIEIDAVIIQDLGLAAIINKYFPKLEMHASTQMVVHNLAGVKACEKLGFSRVVLSRELSMQEISKISDRTKMEIEIFIHGALCYSISGLCLASSYLGGASGNRGRCTQVCRRKFNEKHRSGFYFSAKDLQALDHIDQMSMKRISSLKIEGRMKSAEYVYNVVKAYRKAIDKTEDIEKIKDDLQFDLGREKTDLFLESTDNRGIVNAATPAGTGIDLGFLLNINENSINLDTKIKINIGDRLRFQAREGEEGVSKRVVSVDQNELSTSCELSDTDQISSGDSVFLISKSSSESFDKIKVRTAPLKFKEHFPAAKRVLGSIKYEKNSKKKKLFFKVDSVNWLHLIKKETYNGIILNFEIKDYEELLRNNGSLNQIFSQMIAALPPFISQKELSVWKKLCEDLFNKGVKKFSLGHFSQKEILPPNAKFIAESTVWVNNMATVNILSDFGFDNFCYSPEDDILNLKGIADRRGLLTLFSYVPLFISRIKSPLKENVDLLDSKGEGFFTARKHGLDYLMGSKPLCLIHRQKKMEEIGINNFILDLSFTPPNQKTLTTLMKHYKSGQKLPDTTLFNHKGGLK